MAELTTKPLKSTQNFLRLSEIKSDTIVMNDGSYRAIVAVASINFELKNPEEQNALIYGYQNFINSLDFNIQILMQSRRMDIHSYLEKMKILMEQQSNELLRVQTSEYIEFITKLVENSSIMNKNFYVVVSFSDVQAKAGGFFSFGGSQKDKIEKQVKAFEEVRQKLDQRVTQIIGGLSALGLRSVALKTPEIIELMYNSYNFDAGPLIDATQLGDINVRA